MRVAPGAAVSRRLHRGERLAERAEAGAEQRKIPDQIERGVPRVDPHVPADPAGKAGEPAEALFPADQGDHREAGHRDADPESEPASLAFARGEHRPLGQDGRQSGEQTGARAGKSEAGEQ